MSSAKKVIDFFTSPEWELWQQEAKGPVEMQSLVNELALALYFIFELKQALDDPSSQESLAMVSAVDVLERAVRTTALTGAMVATIMRLQKQLGLPAQYSIPDFTQAQDDIQESWSNKKETVH